MLCDRRAALRRLLARFAGPVRFVQLSASPACEQLAMELRALPLAQELARAQMGRDYGRGFREAYIELIGRLNATHAPENLAWWLMPLTTKNPLSTPLCRQTFNALALTKLAASGDGRPLIALTDSRLLACQMVAWGRRAGVRVVASVRGGSRLKHALKMRMPAAIGAAWLRTTITWLLARPLRPDASDRRACLVITTTIPQSSVGPDGYREAYFGPLVEHLEQDGRRAMLFAVFLTRSITGILALRRLSPPLPIVPVEAALGLRDLLVCGWQSLRRWAEPLPAITAEIHGVDVSELVRQAMRSSYRSSSFFKHLCWYLGARRLAATVPVSRWLYPFENRALEKAVLLGVRNSSPATRLIGCQNAALTPSHTNFVLGAEECRVTPLPDVVFTTGEIVKGWLEREGRFPPALLRVGCALRQNGSLQASLRAKPSRLTNILVALASSLEEYTEVLRFLQEALAQPQPYRLRVRPHPEFPLAEALRRLPGVPASLFEISAGLLSADLAWAHVVVYASSTVGFEAASQGIPAIHLELGHLLNTDPLFNRSDELKWTVTQPQELRTILQDIEAMPDAQFQERQQRSRAYAEGYFRPVTKERLHMMIEAS
ncbi:MAG: hypothetical protein HY596_01660 [Candidatus Omnitrophica bacterium]|nr:hypothetical protein [Candidatus Omnitrophota bacterium]